MSLAKKGISKSKSRKSGKKIWLWILSVVGLIALFIGFKLFGPNTDSFRQGEYLYIPTGATYEQVKQTLEKEGFVKDIKTFDFLAKQSKYPSMVKAGKYHIKKGMSNYNIIRLLRAGKQTPVKLVINKLRTKQDFVRLISNQLEADSNVLQQILNDNAFLSQFGLDSNTAMCAVIPDTYEFWWNTNAEKTYKKFAKYYKTYWTEERLQKAQKIGLTPAEVITVSSIVEEETNYNPEKPNIASVYLNRVKSGMKLQADPTAKFALGDFTVRRITSAITSIPSPYNTYYVTGLPPGPICTPSKKSVEAVLNAPKTNYYYFCAKEDFSGSHRFAATYAEHQQNARLYQQALNKRGIR
ncbi:MAG TPA: endolytic transglycosylase MltG [Flavipsychrobacter sp.]|nr:endolytic transglycosylase MltG [Flavipsychrobacter sp.]